MRMRDSAIALCIGLVFAPVLNAAPLAGQAPLYVGVLEDIDMPPTPKTLSSTIHVRIAFEELHGKWVPINTAVFSPADLETINKNYPKEVRWTVVYDGHDLGIIVSRNPGALQWYGDVGVQTIVSNSQAIPKVYTMPNAFYWSGWKALSRPLVLISEPHYSNPDGWKLTSLTEGEMNRAIRAFRRYVPDMEYCDQPEEAPVRDIPYGNTDVELVNAYRSNKDESVIGLRLKDSTNTCQWFDDKIYYDHWFAVTKSGTIRYLGLGFIPLGAADLDGAGSSEWVFKTFSGEDTDGYELFYDDFSKRAHFTWTWH